MYKHYYKKKIIISNLTMWIPIYYISINIIIIYNYLERVSVRNKIIT